ncbi:MAG: AAA family ATPase [Fusobacterium varium]|uniref:ATP-dependent nuclease n=1 Tax=Fusobacterium varium TaxID=856 RepID=UPI00242D6AC1|nr:AAA family ATPase [Fusobacterium varium]UYI78357.1 MAG: AAA family ATPase [Fusobacterium varium]
MYLKKLKIVNWQCIEYTKIDFENLMLFIGPANNGKSSIMSSIMFFLGYRNLRTKDIRNQNIPLELEGCFSNFSRRIFKELKEYIYNKELKIRITKYPNHEIQYKIGKNREWVEINYDTYINIVSNIPILFIPPFAENEQAEYFVTSFLNILKKRNIDEKFVLKEMKNLSDTLTSEYVSKGLYRTLLFELFRALAAESKKIETSIIGNTMIFFEEPELYLHPQAEKELYDCFIALSKLGVQLYISTHSSNFISLKHYKSICIIRNSDNGSRAFQFKGKLFSGDEVKYFNMNYWINPDRSELFFAKKVILVEGQTDKIVLGYLSKKLGIFKYDYSILECGSKSIIPQFIKLLNAFKLPYIAIYDKDNHFWRTELEIENSNLKNHSIQKSINYDFGDFVEFDNDIEEELYSEKRERKNYKNKPFNALKTVSEENYIIPAQLEKKIRKIFS